VTRFSPCFERALGRNPGAFERFEAVEKARPRGDAAREVDARALERNADRLRDLGECWDGKADEMEGEAMELRLGVALSSQRRSAGLRPEPASPSRPYGRLPTNARKDAA
jgi:hypothetical protein